MTTPQQAPPPQAAAQDTALVLAVLSALDAAVTVGDASAGLAILFRRAGIRPQALTAALTAVMSYPPDAMGASGPATMDVLRLNRVRRAQFVLAAARRLNDGITTAISTRASVLDALQTGIARERRFYGQHLMATWNRASAAAKTDSAASMLGPLLGWYAVNDKVTSAECRAASGRNFIAGQMPLIGYPGMVHPHCRCWPGRPHAGARMLSSGRMAA